MKNKMRRVLAFGCTAIILTVSVLAGFPAKTTKAAEREIMSSDLKEITFSDFDGFQDGTYKNGATKSGRYSGSSLGGTVISGKVMFLTGSNHPFIAFGGNAPGNGLVLRTQKDSTTGERYLRLYGDPQPGNAITQQNFYSAIAGVELVGQEFHLQMSFEFVNHDGGTTNNDLKLGVWFNGRLYNNQYIYLNNYVDRTYLGTYIYACALGGHSNTTGNDSTVKLTSVQPEMMPEGLTNLTFTDFDGFQDGTYKNGATKSGRYSGSSLDGTVISGKVMFSIGSNHPFIAFGGNSPGNGLVLRTQKDSTTGERYLRLYGDPQPGNAITQRNFYSDIARVQLVDNEFELKVSFEFVNHDQGTTSNDLKLGVWFNGRLYNNEYIYLNNYVDRDYLGTCIYACALGGQSSVTGNDSIVKLTSTQKEKMPTELEYLTFSDFVGFQDGTYKNSTSTSGKYSGNSLDGTFISGKVTFNIEGGHPFIAFGGNVPGNGLVLRTQKDSTTGEGYLRLYGDPQPGNAISQRNFYSHIAGVELVGTELELMMSFQFVNHDNGTSENDLKLGVWFGGKLYNNEYIYLDNYVDRQYLGAYVYACGLGTGGLKIESVPLEQIPSGLQNLTYTDFIGFEDGTYKNSESTYGQYNGTSLDGTVVSGKVTFKIEGNNPMIAFGGNAPGNGLVLRTKRDSTGEYLRLYGDPTEQNPTPTYTFYSDVARVQLIGTELDLKMSFQFVNNDGGTTNNDLKLGVWFAGKLYNNEYIYLNDYADREYMGTYLYACGLGTGGLTLQSVQKETLPSDFKHITFTDFTGYKNGTYKTGAYTAGKYSGDSLNRTVVSGSITFNRTSGGEPIFVIGGKNQGYGLVLRTAGDDCLRLYSDPRPANAIKEESFYSHIAGTKLTGAEFNLQMSFEFVNHDGGNTNNDLKLGMWFEGKLYNNEYIYINNYTDTQYAMGTYLYASGIGEGSVTVKAVQAERLSGTLTHLTFTDFAGFEDGMYENGAATAGKYNGTSLDGTMLSGKVTFNRVADDNPVLAIGGIKEKEHGLVLCTDVDPESGLEYLKLFSNPSENATWQYNFYSDIAGTALVGTELELQMSFEFVNHDGGTTKNDLKLGVWFGGTLYNNQYIYLDDYVDTEYSLGTYLYACGTGVGSILLKSIPLEKLPEGLTQLSFWDFCIQDGVFENNRAMTNRYIEDTLDGILFSGKVIYSVPGKEGSALISLGSNSEQWYGLMLKSYVDPYGNQCLRLADAQNRTDLFGSKLFYPSVAGTTLVGTELDLNMTIQYINNDGGTEKNDLKVGMWFNGKLYNNEYIYINNYVDTASTLGTYMTVYAPKGSKIEVKSVQVDRGPIDYSVFGLTSDWEQTLLSKPVNDQNIVGGSVTSKRPPNTGDDTTYMLWLGVSVLCSSIGGYLIYRKKKERMNYEG